MKRAAATLALALFVGSAAAQPPALPSRLTVSYAEYSADRRDDAPILGIMADGTGGARLVLGGGHGAIGFVTVDGHGYLIDEEMGRERYGRQEEMLELAAESGEWRQRGLALGNQRIEIAPRGTETVLGITGQVYAITLIEGSRRSAPYEVVISDDPRLAGTGREMLRVYDLLRAPLIALNGREPQPYTAFRALLAQGTPIRIGRHYRLREFGWRESQGEAFTLTGPVMGRAVFVAMLRQQLMRDPRSDRAAEDVPEVSWNDMAADQNLSAEMDDVNMAADVVAQAASDAANSVVAASRRRPTEAGNAENPH